jgi:hypothetical protein
MSKRGTYLGGSTIIGPEDRDHWARTKNARMHRHLRKQKLERQRQQERFAAEQESYARSQSVLIEKGWEDWPAAT